jgi:hypothetical protein
MVGSPAEVRADEGVRAAYLGSADDPEEPAPADAGDLADLAGVGPAVTHA